MPRNAATQVDTNNTENMEQQVPFKVTITEHNPERGVLANADVNVAGIMTIRNVKIKQDDYGLTVTMPRTKMPHTEQYKDSVYFADKTYEKSVPQQVRKFVESKLEPQQETAQEGAEPQRQGRGQSRRTARQNAARETVSEQTDSGMQPVDEGEVQETGQEQESGMVMSM